VEREMSQYRSDQLHGYADEGDDLEPPRGLPEQVAWQVAAVACGTGQVRGRVSRWPPNQMGLGPAHLASRSIPRSMAAVTAAVRSSTPSFAKMWSRWVQPGYPEPRSNPACRRWADVIDKRLGELECASA